MPKTILGTPSPKLGTPSPNLGTPSPKYLDEKKTKFEKKNLISIF